MRLFTKRSGGPLVSFGITMVLIGLTLVTRPLNDIVQEAQGHCDWLPCITSMTVPFLVGTSLIALIGAFAILFGVRTGRRR
jgi:hypothetical protein